MALLIYSAICKGVHFMRPGDVRLGWSHICVCVCDVRACVDCVSARNREAPFNTVLCMYSVSTKSLRGFEKLWRANKLS
jgi:hypothetical protein